MSGYNKNQFLKEDIALFKRGNSSFINHTQNSIDNQKRLNDKGKGTKGGVSKKITKGKQAGAVVAKTLFRPPTDAEIRNDTRLQPSDFQILKLRVLSKILRDLNLVPKVYRSKPTDVNDSNQTEIGRVSNLFYRLTKSYKDDEPVTNIINDISKNTVDSLNNDSGIPLATMLKGVSDWADITENTDGNDYCVELLSRCANFLNPRKEGINDIYDRIERDEKKSQSSSENKNTDNDFSDDDFNDDDYNDYLNNDNNDYGYEEDEERYYSKYEPSQELIEQVKQTYVKALKFLKKIKQNYKNPAQALRKVEKNHAIKSLFQEPILKDIIQNAFYDTKIKTMGDFKKKVLSSLESKVRTKKTVHANTVIHEIATDNLRVLNAEMWKKDFKQGVKDINQFFNYMRDNETYSYELFKKNYLLSDKKINTFKEWSDLMDYLYKTPGMLYHIDVTLLGSKYKGKGAVVNVEIPKLKKEIASLEKKIKEMEDTGVEADVDASYLNKQKAKIAEIELEREAKKTEKAKLKEELKVLKKSGASEADIEDKKREIRVLQANITALGKKIDTYNFKIRNASGSQLDDLRKKLEDKKYELQRYSAGSFETPENFKDKRELESFIDDEPSKIDYKTSNFAFKATDDKIAKYFEEIMTKLLNIKAVTDENGKQSVQSVNNYINVTVARGKKEGTYTAYIDYPNNNKLYNKLKKDGNYILKIISAATNNVNNKFPGEKIEINKNTIEINKDF